MLCLCFFVWIAEDEKCRRRPVLVLNERERLTHPSARTTAARGGVIVSEREGKKEQLRKIKKKQLVNLLNIQPIHRKYPICFFFLIRSCCLLSKVSCYSSSVTISVLFSRMIPSRLRPYYYTRNSFFVLLLSPNSIL